MVKLGKYFISNLRSADELGKSGGVCLRIDEVSVDAHESRNEPNAHEQRAQERDSPLDLSSRQ